MTARDQASERQIQAADPGLSTWLSANAGSGKTSVLTDRVVRLLLDGVSPQNILCLTYTKAAASEMQNRLFQRLGEWAMKDDGELRQALAKMGVDESADLGRARRLFARAIETPGGLKIQTIHSFCASLLRRFPLEAGVSPQFVEMDERAAKILREQIVEDMADDHNRPLVDGLARYYSGEDFAALTQEIANNRLYFRQNTDFSTIAGWFGLPFGFDENALAAQAFDGGEGALLKALVPLLAAGSSTEVSAAAKLSTIDPDGISAGDLEVFEQVLLFGASAQNPFGPKIDKFPTKSLQQGAAAPFMPALQALMGRVADARPLRVALMAARKTAALFAFSAEFVSLYEDRKLRHGWLDFDDLIQKAGALLTDPGLAAWVLYRLDGGIDHILVDEAQDTSPAQWRVVENLAREFTAGESAKSGTRRTLFVVGDPKQSIYSFQGADPGEFTRMRARFGQGLGEVGETLQNLQLEHSFRSSPAILNLVDFALSDRPGLGDSFKHRAFFGNKPGRVDLWPVIEPVQHKEDREWCDPVERPSPENHNVRLAARVADEIAELLKTGSIQGKDGKLKRIEPGDVMVLVRKRSGGLFGEIIRACKERALPIAGADRLRIGGELAVKDLTALLRFLATPEDDLSLAAALRSPLFGFTEQALYSLAQGRGKGHYLWNRLSERKDRNPDTWQTLHDLRNDADFLRPYDLIERILTRHGGRARLLARLGAEAEDGIDALLSQALAYERLETPSLTGFLLWLEADEVTIKRQMDGAGNQIRVMTVHGAKGLESAVVFLPDTAKPNNRPRNELVALENGGLAWRTGANALPEAVETARARQIEADHEEWIRLLYVAMTRARQWLIVGAAGDVGDAGESWYRILEAGMRDAGAVTQVFGKGERLRYETGVWDRAEESAPTTPEAVSLPGWVRGEAPRPEKPEPALSPSDLGGAKALPGDPSLADPEASLKRGRQIHRLLEFLPDYPEDAWRGVASALLSTGEDSAAEDEFELLVDEVMSVLSTPTLGFLFAREALPEVDITAAPPSLRGKRLHGTIDRLIFKGASILAVDFKSNVVVPERPEDTPEGLLRQMGAYAAALAEVFPGHNIETAILWTRSAKLMSLPATLTAEALARLDAEGPGS